MDALFLLYDMLVTRWLSIRPRRCKQLSEDGAAAWCVPSRRYRAKKRFRWVCPHADPSTLNPLTLEECLCSEGPPAAEATPGPEAPPEDHAEGEAAEGGEVVAHERLEVIGLKTGRGPGDWVTLEATVRNRGSVPLSYASLEVEYFGEERTVLATNLTVVGHLEAGEAKPVKLSKKVPGFEAFRLRFRNVLSAG